MWRNILLFGAEAIVWKMGGCPFHYRQDREILHRIIALATLGHQNKRHQGLIDATSLELEHYPVPPLLQQHETLSVCASDYVLQYRGGKHPSNSYYFLTSATLPTARREKLFNMLCC